MTIVNNLWGKINYLVSEPNCIIKGDNYDSIIWADARPMPTLEQLNNSGFDQHIEDCKSKIADLYNGAMRVLQNGYSDQEVMTFTPKQDAIREYVAGRASAAPEEDAGLVGVAALSADNRTMIEGLAGSTVDADLVNKLDNMVAASATFKQYLGVIERLRDDHLAQLVDGQDNTPVLDSLAQAYAILGG